LRAQIAGVEKDWLAASRADKLVYGAAPEGLALFDVGLTGIQVGIVAAVEVQA
jgi:hypothetical protein